MGKTKFEELLDVGLKMRAEEDRLAKESDDALRLKIESEEAAVTNWIRDLIRPHVPEDLWEYLKIVPMVSDVHSSIVELSLPDCRTIDVSIQPDCSLTFCVPVSAWWDDEEMAIDTGPIVFQNLPRAIAEARVQNERYNDLKHKEDKLRKERTVKKLAKEFEDAKYTNSSELIELLEKWHNDRHGWEEGAM